MTEKEKQALWAECVRFHGHACGGLAVGFQAGLYAMELLELARAGDEEVVCIAENDACGVDAVQALLGCTLGKGNLLLKPRGKQAFSFYRRDDARSVRLVLRATPEKSGEEREQWLMQGDFHEMFDVKPTTEPLPEAARIFKSCVCARCGERAAENHMHLQDGEMVCDDCYQDYRRVLR